MIGVLLFFIIITVYTRKVYRKKKLAASTFLYSLYALSAFSSVVLVFFYGYEFNPMITDYFSGFIYLAVVLLLYFRPFFLVNDHSFTEFTIPRYSIVKFLSWCFVIMSLFSMAYFLPKALLMIFVDVDEVAGLRAAVARGENPLIEETITNTIAGVIASFYTIVLLFFFINVIVERRLSFFAILLLVSSMSYPIFVLAYMGRDGVIFWGFSFIIDYLLFRQFIPKQLLDKLKKYIFIIGVVFASVFVFITIGRFLTGGNDDSGNGVLYPIFSYLGQQSINFTEFFSTKLLRLNYAKGILPLVFGEPPSAELPIENYGLVSWVFKTFFYTIYTNFGPILTVAIGVLFNLIFTMINKYNRSKFSFSFLILYTLFITVYSQGVFYYRQYNRVGNLFIVVMLFISVITIFIPTVRVRKDNIL